MSLEKKICKVPFENCPRKLETKPEDQKTCDGPPTCYAFREYYGLPAYEKKIM